MGVSREVVVARSGNTATTECNLSGLRVRLNTAHLCITGAIFTGFYLL